MTQSFATYKIYIISHHSLVADFNASISLFNSSGRYVGLIQFFPPGSIIPLNLATSNGFLLINYPDSWFREILHVLQSEKPLYATIYESTKVGCIGTAEKEPVGEQEGL